MTLENYKIIILPSDKLMWEHKLPEDPFNNSLTVSIWNKLWRNLTGGCVDITFLNTHSLRVLMSHRMSNGIIHAIPHVVVPEINSMMQSISTVIKADLDHINQERSRLVWSE